MRLNKEVEKKLEVNVWEKKLNENVNGLKENRKIEVNVKDLNKKEECKEKEEEWEKEKIY